MRKHILVITGSGRKNGNSDRMAEQFASGARTRGHEIEFFDATLRPIRPCIACNKCFTDGRPCFHDDEFIPLARAYQRADMVVFSTPLYWFTFPAAMKLCIDKLHSFKTGKVELPIKSAALLACGEFGKESNFDGLLKSYELMLKYMKWEDKGHIIVPNVLREVDLDKRPELMSKLFEFGASI